MRLLSIIFAALIALLAGPALSAPRLVVTIKPIHALAIQVMAGIGTPVLLLKSTASPHAFTLKPSQATALNRADLIIMVDPNLERFLIKTLASLPPGTKVLTLSDMDGITRLKARTQDHAFEPSGNSGNEHNHATFDAHLWLDPENAKKIVGALAAILTTIDRDHAAQYAANAAKAQQRLTRLEHALRQQLAAVKAKPYLVFHDAYQYFEHHFGLNSKGALTLSPDVKPGVRRVYDMRKMIKKHHIRCVFAEPQFSSRTVAAVLEGTDARLGVLDPMGLSIPPGYDAYDKMMTGLAGSLSDCLSR